MAQILVVFGHVVPDQILYILDQWIPNEIRSNLAKPTLTKI